MRCLTSGIRYEKCVVRRFCRCANTMVSIIILYYIMGPPSCIRSVVDRNVVMRRMSVPRTKDAFVQSSSTLAHCQSSHIYCHSRAHTLYHPLLSLSLTKKDVWRTARLVLTSIHVVASSNSSHSPTSVTEAFLWFPTFLPGKYLTRLYLLPLPHRASSCVFYVFDTHLS